MLPDKTDKRWEGLVTGKIRHEFKSVPAAMCVARHVRALAENAFEFHLVKRPQMQARVRLPEGRTASSMSMIELLDIYWDASSRDMDSAKKDALNQLAKTIVDEVNTEE